LRGRVFSGYHMATRIGSRKANNLFPGITFTAHPFQL